MLKLLIIILITVILPYRSFAADGVAVNGKDSLTKTEREFMVLPFGYYTTETSVALGVFSQLKFNEKDRIFGNIIYTFNNQLMFFMISDYYPENIIIHNKLVAENYFAEAYGVGNMSSPEDKYDYRYVIIENFLETGISIYKNSSAFIATDNFYYRPYDDDKAALLYSSSPDQFANGIGLSIKYSDVTDRFFRDGLLCRAGYLYYPESFGNLKKFSVLESEAAYFVSFRESVLNSHFIARSSYGDPHPEKLSALGGSEVLRGYPSGRFTDKCMWAAQIQYDIRFYKDLSLCSFVSAGDVFGNLSGITIKYTKVGYGGGFLYDYKGLTVRMEAATSREKEIQIIVTGNRAF